MRAGARSCAAAALLVLAGSGCQSSAHPPTAGGSVPEQLAPPPVVRILVNGQATPPIDALCSRGIFVATRAHNTSPRPVQTRRIIVSFDPVAGPCTAHTADIDPVLERTLAAGEEGELRVFDAAGSLCQAPHGASSCTWRATATVAAGAGAAAGTLEFRTSELAPNGETGCVRTPTIFTPRDGEVVSGVVGVTASVVESGRCVITARTIVRVYAERGPLVATSSPLDLGDVFRWDTRRVADGRYVIRGAQNCCQIEGDAVGVTVRN